MELRHLRYLVAVADAATFSGAAQQIGVAQPALTRQLRELERELGAELFLTGARRATLTPAGQAAVQVARHVRDEVRLAVERARLVKKGLAGRCVVGVSRAPLMEGLPARLLKLVQARCPEITIELVESEFTTLWNAIADGATDIGIGQAPSRGYPAVLSESQVQGAVDHAVFAADHPLASRASVRLKELHPFPFVWVDTKDDTKHIYATTRDELLRRGFPETGMRGVPSTESIVAVARASLGWSAIPSRIVSGLMGGLTAVPIDDFAVPFRVSRMWRRADNRAVTLTVIDFLRTLERLDRAEGSQETTASEATDPTFVPPRLELRHLRSFVRVVQAGSVGKAAEELGVTQPALSRQMRDLEHDVGVPLLERGTRGARPTVAGESLYKDAEDLLAAADGIKASVQGAERGASGRCIIGAGPMPFVQDLSSSATRLCETRYPSMRVVVRDFSWPKLAVALEDLTIDVGIGHGPHASRPMEGLRRVALISNPINCVLLSPRHPLADRASLKLQELATTPFIFVSRAFSSVVYDRVMVAFAERGFTPRIDATYDGLHTIWSLVSAGLGWCLGAQSQRDVPPPGARPIPLEDLSIPWDVELLYRRDESRAPVLAVIDAVQLRAAELQDTAPPVGFRVSASSTSKAGIS